MKQYIVILAIILLGLTGCVRPYAANPAVQQPMSGVVWGAQANCADMTVSADQALIDGQKFIDGYLPGAQVEEPHRFYGYYTMHVFQTAISTAC